MKNEETDPDSSGSDGLEDTVLAGRYRVAHVVSSGSTAVLVDAIDLETDGPVSVKIVRPEIARNDEFRRKFRRLAEVSHALTHPNIASVSDWGEIDVGGESTVFWTVDALGGGSLRDLLDRGRLIEPGQALVVGLEACRALDAAHQKGLFHTELTPSKMVFGVDRRLRIVDFGMARLIAEPNWIDMATVPTHVARYASPEQALGLPIDAKSDVYALALVLIEAVTGSVPFAADSTVATLAARVDKLLPVSADLGGLASVLERAGRPESEDRFTAAEFGRALVQVAPRLPKPEPLPIIATGLFDTAAMRRPNDPTGGVERPPPAVGLAGVDDAEPTSDSTSVPPSVPRPPVAPPPIVPAVGIAGDVLLGAAGAVGGGVAETGTSATLRTTGGSDGDTDTDTDSEVADPQSESDDAAGVDADDRVSESAMDGAVGDTDAGTDPDRAFIGVTQEEDESEVVAIDASEQNGRTESFGPGPEGSRRGSTDDFEDEVTPIVSADDPVADLDDAKSQLVGQSSRHENRTDGEHGDADGAPDDSAVGLAGPDDLNSADDPGAADDAAVDDGLNAVDHSVVPDDLNAADDTATIDDLVVANDLDAADDLVVTDDSATTDHLDAADDLVVTDDSDDSSGPGDEGPGDGIGHDEQSDSADSPEPDGTEEMPATIAAAAAVAGEPTTAVPATASPADRSNTPGVIYDDEERKRPKGPVIALVVLLVVGLAALAFAATLLLAPKSFDVPALAGVPEAAALNQVAGNDWEVTRDRERSDSFPEPDTVIRTIPGPGVELEEGEPFTLVLSDGPEFRTLPEFEEMSFDAAAARLNELGLNGREADERVFSETLEPGDVVSWQVEGDVDGGLQEGGQILPGRTVVLTLSQGPESRTVPEFVGQTEEQAMATLADLRLVYARAEDVFSEDVPTGVIVEQTPASGDSLDRDATVTVTISKGPDTIVFPDLSGLVFDNARAVLLDTGFELGTLLGTTDGTFVEASINGEDIAAGRELRRGRVIDLIFL